MKEKIIAIGFSVIIISVGLISLILKDNKISLIERRKLTTTSDVSKDFFDNIEDYLSDQFPLRNELLSLNSSYERDILGNKEKNDVYVVDDIIYEKNYPLNEKSIDNFVNKINYIKDKYFKNNKTYYSIIPDKAYFLNEDKYLKIDYNKLINSLNNVNSDYINIIDKVKIDDYYKTDIHIKQESWLKLVPYLSKKLGFNYYNINYKKEVYNDFYGASYSKVINGNKDKLTYLVNSYQDSLIVNHLEYGNKPLYEVSKLGTSDSYDVFLSGPSAFIEISNKNSTSNKELIIFRDSFGSSLIPLLTPYYSKITLIDLRYISSDLLGNYLSVNSNQEVLFLYSTLIINDSSILKVNMK